MLVISKPTHFGPDGLALRGQCHHDSPGWQLRWFESGHPIEVIWQGAFKTCRYLQGTCTDASTFEEAKREVERMLAADEFGRIGTMPTDKFPATRGGDAGDSDEPAAPGRKRRKKRRR